MLHVETPITTSQPITDAPAPAPAEVNPLKVGAITYKSLRHAARVLAKKTGETENIAYGRLYQRFRAGYTLSEAMSTKPLKKGKKGMDVEFNGKIFDSLSDAIKAWTKKNRKILSDDEFNTLYSRVLNRIKSGMTFEDAISTKDDLRAVANGHPITVGGQEYPSLMDAIRAHTDGEVSQSTYIRFVAGLKAGKTFEKILATPVRQYVKRKPSAAEKMAEEYDEMTEMLQAALASDDEAEAAEAAEAA